MANKQFKLALEKNISSFKDEYLEISRQEFTNSDGKLIHPGEFGMEREKICKNLFEKFIASHIEINNGFVINAKDQISTQQDLIFYDKNNTPILNIEDRRFFPVETIACVGQVKSVIQSKEDLKKALLELVEVKKIRENIPHPSCVKTQKKNFGGVTPYEPKTFVYDQIFTFLVCEKFNFNISQDEINELYPIDTPPCHKHNTILDLKKGVYQYLHKTMQFPYPEVSGEILKPSYVENRDGYNHVMVLLSNLSIATHGTTMLHVELSDYY